MKRKVIQQGPSTLMVSLPSKWAREIGIRRGDEINVDLLNNQLVVSTERRQKGKKATLHLKKKEDYLDRMLMSRYREGYDEVHIAYDDPETIELIRETLKYLLGFEIVEQTAKSCLIKNVSEGSNEDYPAMFRRMFQVMLTMGESCLEYVKTGNRKSLKIAIDLRETLIKLEQFNLRLINSQNSVSLQQKSLEFFYVWNIATFGKMWASLARKPLSKNPSFSKKDVWFMKEVVGYTRAFYDCYYDRDREKLLQMKRKLYALRPASVALLNSSRNRHMVFYLMRMLNRTYEVTLSFDL
jgi:phosphate uptake regulator